VDFLAPQQACVQGLGASPTFLYQLGHPPGPAQALPVKGKNSSEWLEIKPNQDRISETDGKLLKFIYFGARK
jgi:hypothetical protein